MCTRPARRALQGLELVDGEYRALPPQIAEGGRTIRSEVLGLDIRVDGELLRFRDPATGRDIPHRAEVAAAAERAKAAAKRAKAAGETGQSGRRTGESGRQTRGSPSQAGGRAAQGRRSQGGTRSGTRDPGRRPPARPPRRALRSWRPCCDVRGPASRERSLTCDLSHATGRSGMSLSPDTIACACMPVCWQ